MIYLILILLIFFSAIFSSSETSLLSIERIKLIKKKQNRIVKEWLEKPYRIISFILVGNNIVNIVFSSLVSIYFISRFSEKLSDFSSEILSFTVVSVIILVFGEAIPKLYANVKPERVFNFSSSFLVVFYFVLSPVVNFFSFLSEVFIGRSRRKDGNLTEKKISDIVSEGAEELGISLEVRKMISSVFSLKNKRVKEIMTDKKNIVFLNINISRKDLIDFMVDTGYSRYPVYKDSLDNVVGILYVKDFLLRFIRGKNFDIGEILRKPVFIDPDEEVSNIYKRMLNERFHLGIVRKDKKVFGLITLEDILEEVFGEIEDEYD